MTPVTTEILGIIQNSSLEICSIQVSAAKKTTNAVITVPCLVIDVKGNQRWINVHVTWMDSYYLVSAKNDGPEIFSPHN